MASAVVRAAGEGEKRWFLGGGLHTWKVRATDSDGSLVVFEDELEGGKLTPLHMHADVDEAIYVLEGEIVLEAHGEPVVVGAGGFAFAPRGVPHAFMVRSDRARLLAIQTPGSGESFYIQASETVTDGSTSGPVDFERLGAIAAETGATTILGPPPFAMQ